MHLLFTKKIDTKLISEKIGDLCSYDFREMIQLQSIPVKVFELKNKSIIFTSIQGVKSFFENQFQPCEDFTDENYNKIYVVGQKTKQELRKFGFGTYKVFRHAKELSDFIVENCKNEVFLHFCGNLALDILDENLSLQNIQYKKIVVYQSYLLYPKLDFEYDSIAFFSPSGVRSYVKNNSLEGKCLFSIGFTTEKEIKKYTNQKVITSKESNLKDLLKLIIEDLKSHKVTDTKNL